MIRLQINLNTHTPVLVFRYIHDEFITKYSNGDGLKLNEPPDYTEICHNKHKSATRAVLFLKKTERHE